MITKKTEEIELLRESGRRLAVIIKKVCDISLPGTSTADLNALAHKLIVDGGDTPAFLNYTPEGARRAYPASTCISINDEVVHGIPNEEPKILKEGDIVTIDISLSHKGFFTDSAVTIAVGTIDAQAKKLLEATERSLMAGIAEATVGHSLGHIGSAIETIVKKAGFSIADGLCGHGIGRKVHEEPFVPNFGLPGEGEMLKKGMVIAIEPICNEGTSRVRLKKDGYTYVTSDGKRSAHFEHTIMITDSVPEIFTKI